MMRSMINWSSFLFFLELIISPSGHEKMTLIHFYQIFSGVQQLFHGPWLQPKLMYSVTKAKITHNKSLLLNHLFSWLIICVIELFILLFSAYWLFLVIHPFTIIQLFNRQTIFKLMKVIMILLNSSIFKVKFLPFSILLIVSPNRQRLEFIYLTKPSSVLNSLFLYEKPWLHNS